MGGHETTGEAPAVLVVCDAGPLIHLDQLGCLDFLRGFGAVFVSETVWEEVERHRPGALSSPQVPLRRRTPPHPPPPTLETLISTLSLDEGEAEALNLLLSLTGERIFLTDDLPARTASESLSIEAHGTIGLIVRAIRQGFRQPSQVVEILEELPTRSTLHIQRSLLEAVIERVRQAHGLSEPDGE